MVGLVQSRGSQRPKQQEINTLILELSELSVLWHGKRKCKKRRKHIESSMTLFCQSLTPLVKKWLLPSTKFPCSVINLCAILRLTFSLWKTSFNLMWIQTCFKCQWIWTINEPLVIYAWPNNSTDSFKKTLNLLNRMQVLDQQQLICSREWSM